LSAATKGSYLVQRTRNRNHVGKSDLSAATKGSYLVQRTRNRNHVGKSDLNAATKGSYLVYCIKKTETMQVSPT